MVAEDIVKWMVSKKAVVVVVVVSGEEERRQEQKAAIYPSGAHEKDRPWSAFACCHFHSLSWNQPDFREGFLHPYRSTVWPTLLGSVALRPRPPFLCKKMWHISRGPSHVVIAVCRSGAVGAPTSLFQVGPRSASRAAQGRYICSGWRLEF